MNSPTLSAGPRSNTNSAAGLRHWRDLLQLSKAEEKLLIRYEDLSSNQETLRSILNFFDAWNTMPRERVAETFFEK